VVAVEDERFYDHGALDPEALVRALWTTLTRQHVDPGGSTITQQLAKLLYVSGTGAGGRLRDVGLAFKLEEHYSKRQILEMYLNVTYFGGGFYGIDAAARGYFGRPPGALTWTQASMLAGLPQAPSAFDPQQHLAAARARQREVLQRMVASGVLSAAQARRVLAAKLGTRTRKGRPVDESDQRPPGTQIPSERGGSGQRFTPARRRP